MYTNKSYMDTTTEKQLRLANQDRIAQNSLLVFATVLSIVVSTPVYSQFTDLPEDAKTIDIGVSGNGNIKTLTLTTVLPINNINGWAGFFGSRVSGEEGIISELIKLHVEGGIQYKDMEFEAFSDFERNITDGTALLAQVGGTIQPKQYKKGTFSITANFGYFVETFQPFEDFTLRRFDPTSFRWLVSSILDWQQLNTEITFTPEVGFKNYRLCAEPAYTLDLTTRLGLRLSGTLTYNSALLTDNIRYNYLSILRFTL